MLDSIEGIEQYVINASTQRRLAENTSLKDGEKPRLMSMYLALTDRLLRQQPLTKRAEIALKLFMNSEHYGFFDGNMKTRSSGAMVNDILGARIKFHHQFDSEIVDHEGLHFLQDILKIVPRNNALTYTVGTLADCMDHPLNFKGKEYAHLKSEYSNISSNEYFQSVLAGTADRYLRGGWMLNPDELRKRAQSDQMTRQILDYVENESLYDREFETGEVDSSGRIKEAYTPMSNIGIQRGIRAAAFGHFTGNIENGWTLVWLHSLGLPFAEAERIATEKFLNGTLGDYAIDKRADINSLDLYLQSEKLHKTQHLETNAEPIGAIGKITASAKERALTQLRQSSLSEPINQEKLAHKYRIYEEAMMNRRSINTESGGHSVVLADLQNRIAHLADRAKTELSQIAANVYAFAGNGERTLKIHEIVKKPQSRFGIHLEPPIPIESSAHPLDERIGRVHIRPGKSGPIATSDIISLLTDNSAIFTIIVQGDSVYFIEKSQATIEKLQGMQKKDRHRHIEEIIQRNTNSTQFAQHDDTEHINGDVNPRMIAELGLKMYSLPIEAKAPSSTQLFILPQYTPIQQNAA